jgi:hypothetical protein
MQNDSARLRSCSCAHLFNQFRKPVLLSNAACVQRRSLAWLQNAASYGKSEFLFSSIFDAWSRYGYKVLFSQLAVPAADINI